MLELGLKVDRLHPERNRCSLAGNGQQEPSTLPGSSPVGSQWAPALLERHVNTASSQPTFSITFPDVGACFSGTCVRARACEVSLSPMALVAASLAQRRWRARSSAGRSPLQVISVHITGGLGSAALAH